MNMISLDFICSLLEKNNKKGLGNESIKNFIINSKEVNFGDCFIGLPGTNYDGSSFFYSALEKGAIGLILHSKYENEYLKICDLFPHSWAFFVDDTKLTLINLAKKWRSLFHIPIIAITGSVGKTTTKELLKTIFSNEGYSVCATKNSENGSIGLPLTILSLRENHNIAIFEIGIQKPGEMDLLLSLLQSVTYTVITTILPAHILYFNNLENIIAEKTKLQYITKEILFIDYSLKKYTNHKHIITFGDYEQADVFYHSMSTKISLEIHNEKYSINTLYHKGIHHCITAAFSVCYFLKLKINNVIFSIESFQRVNGRFSIHHLKNGGIIINDCWNAAHPTVMLKSIEAFEQFPTNKKKIMVLADMLEQGEFKETSHNLIIEKINIIPKAGIEKIFYIGSAFKESAKNNIRDNIYTANSFLDISDEIYNYLNQKYCIFFKGSNGMKLFYHINEYIKKENKS